MRDVRAVVNLRRARRWQRTGARPVDLQMWEDGTQGSSEGCIEELGMLFFFSYLLRFSFEGLVVILISAAMVAAMWMYS